MDLQDAYVKNFGVYFILAVLISLAFRVVISLARAKEYGYITDDKDPKINVFKDYPFKKRFVIILHGFSEKDPYPDFWYNTVIGVIELLGFPVLMKVGQYGMVGAWIGFKSLAQWNAWTKNRHVFNRFLIAHALILIICFYWLIGFVEA